MYKIHGLVIITLITLSLKLFTFHSTAQPPQGFSYQAIITDEVDEPLENTTVGMRITLLEGGETGTPVYVETHTPTTDHIGHVSLVVGDGTVVSGDFASIVWGAGEYWVRVETDPDGGTNYTISGTSQLLSVPFAMHTLQAAHAGQADFANTAAAANTAYSAQEATQLERDSLYLGKPYLGGIIFYLYLDEGGQQRGLVVSVIERQGLRWSTLTNQTNATRTWDGYYNTSLIPGVGIRTWVTSEFSEEWYIPSIDELMLLFQNRFHVNKALFEGNHTLLSQSGIYWSSTESDSNSSHAYAFSFHTASAVHPIKTTLQSVRAIRSF